MTTSLSTTSIREVLRQHLADVLYCEPDDIGDDAIFKELGLDSVLGVELISLVNTRYGLGENLDTVYAHPTLARLADHVSKLARATPASPA